MCHRGCTRDSVPADDHGQQLCGHVCYGSRILWPDSPRSAKAQALSDVSNPKAVDGKLAQVVGIGLEHLSQDRSKQPKNDE